MSYHCRANTKAGNVGEHIIENYQWAAHPDGSLSKRRLGEWLRYRQNLRRNLRPQLVAARDRDELAAVLLQFLRDVLPIAGASIMVDDHMSRAQACGAQLTVASQVGRGTRVRLSVPYEGQA